MTQLLRETFDSISEKFVHETEANTLNVDLWSFYMVCIAIQYTFETILHIRFKEENSNIRILNTWNEKNCYLNDIIYWDARCISSIKTYNGVYDVIPLFPVHLTSCLQIFRDAEKGCELVKGDNERKPIL